MPIFYAHLIIEEITKTILNFINLSADQVTIFCVKRRFKSIKLINSIFFIILISVLKSSYH